MAVDTRAGRARENARQWKNLYKRRAFDAEAKVARLEGEKAEAQRWAIAANVHRQVQEFITADEARIRKHSDACLERVGGRNVALAAALRGLRSLMIDLRNHEGTAVGWKVAIGVWVEAIDAALKDTQTGTAGEGWLPPEVREQVGTALEEIKRLSSRNPTYLHPTKEFAARVLTVAEAALDALKVKRDEL